MPESAVETLLRKLQDRSRGFRDFILDPSDPYAVVVQDYQTFVDHAIGILEKNDDESKRLVEDRVLRGLFHEVPGLNTFDVMLDLRQ